MKTIREFEERLHTEIATGEIPGFTHLYSGQEAVAVGVCEALTDADYIASTHRGHGHCIAKGCDIIGMMKEIYGRADGLCKGKGGSMHPADFGMPAEAVDGSDFFAVHAAMARALQRARAGKGPSTIEAVTTRFFGHFEGDPQRYRATDEVVQHRAVMDCLKRFRARMEAD